jgi:cytochrome c oxidase subunit 2
MLSFSFKIGFQDPATKTMEGLVDLHNYIFFYLLIVFFLVIWVFSTIVWEFFFIAQHETYDRYIHNLRNSMFKSLQVSHGTMLEVFWTITPSVILLAIAIPSFRLIYLADAVLHPMCTIKVIGHQWYWSAEYSDMDNNVAYDMNMVYEDSLRKGGFRLLETELPLLLPLNTPIRVLVTSQDVLHSFSVNSLGIKIDACPGRLNQVGVEIKRPGVYYGQCSEICGAGHSQMPIKIVTVNSNQLYKLLLSLEH